MNIAHPRCRISLMSIDLGIHGHAPQEDSCPWAVLRDRGSSAATLRTDGSKIPFSTEVEAAQKLGFSVRSRSVGRSVRADSDSEFQIGKECKHEHSEYNDCRIVGHHLDTFAIHVCTYLIKL